MIEEQQSRHFWFPFICVQYENQSLKLAWVCNLSKHEVLFLSFSLPVLHLYGNALKVQVDFKNAPQGVSFQATLTKLKADLMFAVMDYESQIFKNTTVWPYRYLNLLMLSADTVLLQIYQYQHMFSDMDRN